jgi:hypothetical protein
MTGMGERDFTSPRVYKGNIYKPISVDRWWVEVRPLCPHRDSRFHRSAWLRLPFSEAILMTTTPETTTRAHGAMEG